MQTPCCAIWLQSIFFLFCCCGVCVEFCGNLPLTRWLLCLFSLLFLINKQINIISRIVVYEYFICIRSLTRAEYITITCHQIWYETWIRQIYLIELNCHYYLSVFVNVKLFASLSWCTTIILLVVCRRWGFRYGHYLYFCAFAQFCVIMICGKYESFHATKTNHHL